MWGYRFASLVCLAFLLGRHLEVGWLHLIMIAFWGSMLTWCIGQAGRCKKFISQVPEVRDSEDHQDV